MTRILANGMLAWIAATSLLPANGLAGTIFTLSSSIPFQSNGSGVSGSGSSEVVTIDYTDLIVGIGGVNTDYSGSYVETYTNSTGVLSLTGTNGISMTADGATGLVGAFAGNSIQLYSAVTSLVFDSAFLAELGLVTNPPLAEISGANFGVTANGSQVTSAVGTLQIIPEPSTFAMLGTSLLLGIGFKIRKQVFQER